MGFAVHEYNTPENYVRDPALFWRLRPNHVIVPSKSAPESSARGIHVNSRGLRGAETASFPAPGVVRLACLGDSHTFGWGVEDDQAFPTLLDAGLAGDGVPVECVNAGAPGYSSRQVGIMLERVVLPDLHPQVVLLAFGHNDVTPVLFSDDARSLAIAEGRRAAPPRFAYTRTGLEALLRLIARDVFSESPRVSEAGTRANLNAMIDACRRAGIEILVAPTAHNAIQRAVGRARGVPVQDLFPRDYREPDAKLVQADGVHPTPLGQQRIAARLRAWRDLREALNRARASAKRPVPGRASSESF